MSDNIFDHLSNEDTHKLFDLVAHMARLERQSQGDPKREEYFEFRRALHNKRNNFCVNNPRRPTHVLLGHQEYHTMIYGAMCYEGPVMLDHRLKGTAPQFEGLIVLHVFQDSLLEVVHLPE